MLVPLLLAAALAASPGAAPRTTAVQSSARVTVRVLSGYRLTASATSTPDGAVQRTTTVRSEDGSPRTAQLVEFN